MEIFTYIGLKFIGYLILNTDYTFLKETIRRNFHRATAKFYIYKYNNPQPVK